MDLDGHYRRVIDAITRGKIVPFLGTDINLCGRQQTADGTLEGWQQGQYPPSDRELAIYLDQSSNFSEQYEVRCPLTDTNIDAFPEACSLKTGPGTMMTRMGLHQVAEYVLSQNGPDALGSLYELFEAQYLPNPIHKFLAQLPTIMRNKGNHLPYPLIVTACFDQTLEQAFEAEGQPYDLVSFISDAEGGRFEHQPPGKAAHRIERPQEYQAFALNQRPVILKLHGRSANSCVITEDHYIDYLARQDIAQLLPAPLLAKLRQEHHIWFLGYTPHSWNLRVVLHRLWPDLTSQRMKNWWAVQTELETIDSTFWQDIIGRPTRVSCLEEYIAGLEQHLQQLPGKGSPAVTVPRGSLLSEQTIQRNQIFISYSHKDQDWLQRLQNMLKPALRNQDLALKVWNDSHIQVGDKWRAEIKAALAAAKVGVLLVSDDFLASDFIAQEELPPLLEAAEQEGLQIFWVYLRDCLYEYSAISEYQAAHDVTHPLEHLSETEQQSELRRICKQLIAMQKA